MQIERHFSRWQVKRQAKVKLEGASNFINCQIDDISFSGIKICLLRAFPKDTYLKFSLVLSHDFIFDIIEAWVVWHKTVDSYNVYGLYFTKIKDQDKEKIYQFLHKYAPEQVSKKCWESSSEEKGGETMEDRRVFQRFTAKLPLRFLDAKSGKEGSALTQDISAKGIGMVTHEELKPRTSVEVWLRIPDQGEPLYTRGEVIWSKSSTPGEYKAGIDLERADLMGLSRILRSNDA